MKRTEDSFRDLWVNITGTNIWIIGVPEEEEEKKGYEKIFEEIIVGNFPNMEKGIVNQVQEAQRVLYRVNPRWQRCDYTHFTDRENQDPEQWSCLLARITLLWEEAQAGDSVSRTIMGCISNSCFSHSNWNFHSTRETCFVREGQKNDFWRFWGIRT